MGLAPPAGAAVDPVHWKHVHAQEAWRFVIFITVLQCRLLRRNDLDNDHMLRSIADNAVRVLGRVGAHLVGIGSLLCVP